VQILATYMSGFGEATSPGAPHTAPPNPETLILPFVSARPVFNEQGTLFPKKGEAERLRYIHTVVEFLRYSFKNMSELAKECTTANGEREWLSLLSEDDGKDLLEFWEEEWVVGDG
jgi:hypothetical protein